MTQQAPIVKTGDIISFQKVRSPLPTSSSYDWLSSSGENEYTLVRTPSTYTYGQQLLTRMDEGETYIVCNGDPVHGFCLALQEDPSRPIGFGLFYDDDMKPCIRITQVGFEYVPVNIIMHGTTDTPPLDKYFIGSKVIMCTSYTSQISKASGTIS